MPKLHRRKEATGSVCLVESLIIGGATIKDFCTKLEKKKNELYRIRYNSFSNYNVYIIMSVLLLSLVLGFLIVFREFGMISE